MIDVRNFVSENFLFCFILGLIIIEGCFYFFECKQDFEKWKEHLKINIANVLIYGILPLLAYLASGYLLGK